MTLANLPEELLLHIITFVEPQELWLSIRGVSKLFDRIIESHLKTSAVPYFVVGVNYTLGAGAHHHWYDVRASVFLSYNSIDKENNDLAFFDKMTVHPEPYHDRAMKKWNEIAATKTDPETMWRVQLRNGNPRTCEMRFIQVPSAVISEKGVTCAWRELLTAYFQACRAAEPVAAGVSELTTPASLHAAAISYVRGTS